MKPTHDSLLLRVSCLRTHQTVLSDECDDFFLQEVAVQFCDCKPDFLRLLRFNLWGVMPTKQELLCIV